VSIRPIYATGVDPGMGDPSAVVTIMELAGRLPTVVGYGSCAAFGPGVKPTKLDTAEQLRGAAEQARCVLLLIDQQRHLAGPHRIAVEGYVDAGKGMAKGRYLVPFLLGALWSEAYARYTSTALRAADWANPHAWWWQSPSVMSSYGGAVHLGRGEQRQRALQAFDRQLCEGWSNLTTDHLRAAGAHALHALGRMRSERLHLTSGPE
jgi:hypothetical protein